MGGHRLCPVGQLGQPDRRLDGELGLADPAHPGGGQTDSPPASIAMYAVYVAAAIGLGGVWLGWFFWQLRQHPLLPVNDPQLAEAVAAGGHH